MDVMSMLREKARAKPRRILLPEAEDERVWQAAAQLTREGLVTPILLGDAEKARAGAAAEKVSLKGIEIINPATHPLLDEYAKGYAAKRGIAEAIAKKMVKRSLFFGAMHVAAGRADGMVGGAGSPTAQLLLAASHCIGQQEGVKVPSSFFIMIIPEYMGEKDKVLLYADCAVNPDPSAEELAGIGVATAHNARALLGMEPRVAFLSFSTKGSASHPRVDKVRAAVEMAIKLAPGVGIDGELQGDSALSPRVAKKKCPGSAVAGNANVLVFPDLDSGNIGYKLTQYLANAKAFGPVLQGFKQPVNDLSRGATVEDVVAVAVITAAQVTN